MCILTFGVKVSLAFEKKYLWSMKCNYKIFFFASFHIAFINTFFAKWQLESCFLLFSFFFKEETSTFENIYIYSAILPAWDKILGK